MLPQFFGTLSAKEILAMPLGPGLYNLNKTVKCKPIVQGPGLYNWKTTVKCKPVFVKFKYLYRVVKCILHLTGKASLFDMATYENKRYFTYILTNR
jgi:hypothetical protein